MTLTSIKKAGLDEIALDHVFTIGASGTDHYTFQGEGLNGTVNDPTLYLTRGKTYRFENGTGAHAIRIQSADDGTSGTLYNTGVTNNNTTGTVIVEVQHDAPDVLYYQCASHANMKGTIYVTGALPDLGVTTAKIADDAVTNDKLANSVVASISANTAKTSNATHTGDVTGSTLLTIAANAVETGMIEDQAVTLAKLEHGTSSNDGKFLRANNGADPTFETVTSTNIISNAANRVILGSDTANTLNTDSALTYASNYFNVGDAALKSNQLKFAPTGTVYIDHYTTGQDIQFRTSVSSQIDTTGPTIKSTGNIAFASGKGIDFSATANTSASNASMTNELFADYEVGTWYPVIRFYNSGTWSQATMTTEGTRTGCSYVKIGNMCFFHLGWDGFEVSNSSYAVIGGLPFQSNGRGSVVVNYTNMFTNNQNQGGHISGSSEQMEFYHSSYSWNGIHNNSSGRYIYADGFYKVS